jgi:competence protein ComEA
MCGTFGQCRAAQVPVYDGMHMKEATGFAWASALVQALALTAATCVPAPAAGAQSDLPDGPGKPLVAKICSGCHSFSYFAQSRGTKDHWSAIVDDMVSRGAEGTDEELDQVVDYLAGNFGPERPRKINVNKATAAELAKALAISQESAGAIVQYRSKNGDFKNLEALERVPGVDARRIEEKKDWIEF